jgi:hypothetical protein
MASKSKRARMAPQRNIAKTFLYWAVTVFVFKLLVIFSIPATNFDILAKPYKIEGAWLGADGENYITGFSFLTRDGLFSSETKLGINYCLNLAIINLLIFCIFFCISTI